MQMEDVVISHGRSLAETPTYSVACVVTVLVFVCFIVERSIYRFGKWLKKTRRKALFASLEKIKEELMVLGVISLLLAQWARWISEICVNSSLFSSKIYLCSEDDYGVIQNVLFEKSSTLLNESHIPSQGINTRTTNQCGEGREPFVSLEGLEQLHRFLFVLGINHVLYSCVAVGLAMSKIYNWRKWENQATTTADGNLQEKKAKVLKRQSTFVFHHTSHPWSRNPVLIWMLCFLRQFRSSVKKSDYLALRLGFITKHGLPLSYNFHRYMVRSMEDEFHGILGISFIFQLYAGNNINKIYYPTGSYVTKDDEMLNFSWDCSVFIWPLWGYAIVCIFINIHGLNIYFWLSFIPVILVMLVGTKLQHVVSSLALEIVEQTGPSVGTQVRPRDDLFWFRKPEILLRLIQFIIFQNAFEMAIFIWSLWGFKQRSCFMQNDYMIIIRLTSGALVQFWCSYSTVPLNIIIMQMGSQCKKALVAESVRKSLHSWCKRVKEKSKRGSVQSVATRSVCSVDTTIDEGDEITVASGTISRSSSLASLNDLGAKRQQGDDADTQSLQQDEISLRIEEYLNNSTLEPLVIDEEDNSGKDEEPKVDTFFDLFQKT